MNKLVKGSIAAAAGIALLLGGAGSLAVWSDATSINAGTVTSGVLDITSATGGTWSPVLAKIVPGDTVTYTKTINLTATGDNLKATVSSNIGSITNTIAGSTATATYVVKNASSVVIVPASGVYTLGAGAYTVEATIVVSLPDTVINQVGQNGTADLTALTVTVTQSL